MVASPASPAVEARERIIARHWRLAAFVACSLVPFAPSLWAMRSFLLADNALGFVPFLVPAAAWLFLLRSRLTARPAKRDVLLDCFFAVPPLLLALFLLFLTPAKLSWYFWLYRVDLLAFALVTLGVGVVFLGYQQVLRAWQALALLFLVWPYPVVRLQELVIEPMTAGTVATARAATAFLQLPYEVDGSTFTSTHLPDAERFSITLSGVCSGSALTMGFLLLGTVLCCVMRGPLARRLRWLAAGVLLAYAANLVRVVALLVASSQVSYTFGLDVLHPALGLVLFALVVATMLALLRPFGLAFAPRPRGEHRAWEPADGGGRALRVVYVATAAAALVLGVFVAQAQQYTFLRAGEGAPVVDLASERALLPDVPGWELSHLEQIGWTDLFGEASRGALFQYAYPTGPTVIAQVVIADERAALERYSIEQCIVFHRSKVETVEYVTLPRGMTGIIVHDTFEGTPSSTLYWQHPVRVDGEIRHARIALLLDVEEPVKHIDRADLPAARTLAERYGVEFTTMMEGRPPTRGDVRGIVDLELLELGSRIVEAMVQTGGTGG